MADPVALHFSVALRALLLADVRDAGDLDQRIGFHQPALDAIARGFLAGEVLGIHLVDLRVVGPVGEHDHVEGDVVHAAAGGLDDALDGFQDVSGLGGGLYRGYLQGNILLETGWSESVFVSGLGGSAY